MKRGTLIDDGITYEYVAKVYKRKASFTFKYFNEIFANEFLDEFDEWEYTTTSTIFT